MSLDALYQELHLLAVHYHWSESDILRLTASKRRRYLRLIESHAGAARESEPA
jgi:hypothetical protein